MSQSLHKKNKVLVPDLTISGLYPALAQDEQADAEYRLLGYLGIVKRIFERVCRENPRLLTELQQRATMRKQGEVAK